MNLKANFIFISLCLFLTASCNNPFGKNTSVESLFTPGFEGENIVGGTPLLILGLDNDSVVANDKTWTWSCNRDCTSRFLIDQSPTSTPSGAFSSTLTASVNSGDGTFYIHVQAQDDIGNTSEVFHASVMLDNTAPVLSGSLNFVSSDRSSTQTNSMTWTASAADPAPISFYEMSIASDNGDETCSSLDTSENTLAWFPVPTAADFTSSGYQIVRSNLDNNGAAIDFVLQEYTFYCVSLRAVDSLGQISNVILSQPLRLSVVPTSLGDLLSWVDSTAPDSLFQNTDCSTSPSLTSDSVACWRDQSGNGRHFTQSSSSLRPTRNSNGISFDGNDDVISNSATNFNANTDTTYFVVTEFANQSTNGGSCCRPIVSFVTNGGSFFPWIASTRGNLSPPNSIFHGWDGSPLNPISASPGDFFLMTASHDGNAKLWNTYTNGSQSATNVSIPSSYPTSTILNIGGDSSNSARRYAGAIQEVIFYSRVLSTTEIQDIEGYLACKWDLRDQLFVGHPYYNINATSEDGCP